MTDDKQFCLTLDLENDWYFDEPGYDHLTLEYLDEFIELLTDMDIPLSVFVVGKTIEKHPEAVDRLSNEINCEFHLHSYQHDTSKSYDFREEIIQGKKAFREHFGQNPTGYRAPQWNISPQELKILEQEGFNFDSSVLPSYRPGIYQNLRAPMTPSFVDGTENLVEIPPSVLPAVRVPLVHSYAKLFGRLFSEGVSMLSLPNIVIYTIHLHDLYQTKSFENLSAVKQTVYERNQESAEQLLRTNVSTILKQGYDPIQVSDIIASFSR